MRAVDPVDVLVRWLREQDGIPSTAPTGDLVGRETGDTTILLAESGGFRAIRDRMDRVDIEYDVRHTDRGECKRLALLCRKLLLEELAATKSVGGIEVLDVEDISRPQYYPDSTSREHVYGGEVVVFYVDA